MTSLMMHNFLFDQLYTQHISECLTKHAPRQGISVELYTNAIMLEAAAKASYYIYELKQKHN